MILYNIRANGPFEYDKFMLLLGQLHNLYQDALEAYQKSQAVQQAGTLSDKIDRYTAALQIDTARKSGSFNSILNQVAAYKEALL